MKTAMRLRVITADLYGDPTSVSMYAHGQGEIYVTSYGALPARVAYDGFEAQNGTGAPLAVGRAVASSGGAVVLADASSVALSQVAGIVTRGAGTALPAIVQPAGPLTLTTAQWDAVTGQTGGLSPGAIYYLASGGGISTSPPTTPGQSVAQIGRALTSTQLLVQILHSVML